MARKRPKFVQGKYELTEDERAKYKGTYPITYRSSYELAFIRFCCRTREVISWGSESTVVYYLDKGRKLLFNHIHIKNHSLSYT